MNVYEKLLAIQTALKAPKSQRNTFGNYNYRSCEDILESVKPLCGEHKAALFLSDTVEEIGGRIYVKATATLIDVEKPADRVVATAYAREEESKKGMDGSQVTGASSSYARKYALNGLFDIDDTKDSDATNDHGKGANPAPKKAPAKPAKATEKPKTGLSKEVAAELNQNIFNYSNASGVPVKNVNAALAKELGKPLAAATDADAEKIIDLITMWMEELKEGIS